MHLITCSLPIGIIITLTILAEPCNGDLNITIPSDYKVEKKDTYVCTAVELEAVQTGYSAQLVGVEPHGDRLYVHHILVYGCSQVAHQPGGKRGATWDCLHHAICSDGGSILYGWGRNAAALRFPDGVGMAIGQGSGVPFIVVQVHYTNPRPPNDKFGVTLKTSAQPSPLSGGLISFATFFTIPPAKPSHLVENSFCYQGHQPLTVFAARVHTHVLGRSVYLQRQGWGSTDWQMLFSNDPQLPQAFYPTTLHQIWPGDKLKVTCDFDSSNKSSSTYAGSSHTDEMCNLYAMVYSRHPYIVNNDNNMVLASSSGAMPATGTFQPDPSPLWKPPQPHEPAPLTASSSAMHQLLPPASVAHNSHDSTQPTATTSVLFSRNTVADPAETVGMVTDTKPLPEMPAEAPVGMAQVAGFNSRHIAPNLQHIKASAQAQGTIWDGYEGHPLAVEGGTGIFGDVSGVTVAGDGSVWALYRGSRSWTQGSFQADKMRNASFISENVVLQLDADTGTVLAAWGAGLLSMPHMITVDREGAVYVADAGRHQVLKFTPVGVLLSAVGQKMEPGQSRRHLCKPTQVAVALDGTLFISDGYCNSRIVKFGADGRFLGEATVPRLQSGATAVVHSVLLDECEGTVMVAAREAGQVYAFDMSSLELKKSYDLSAHGRVWSLLMGPYAKVLALSWEEGKDAVLLEVGPKRGNAWVLPGLQQRFPHDIALTAAPTVLTGTAERLFALLVAPLCAPPGCGPLLKYVLEPSGFQLPIGLAAMNLPQATGKSTSVLLGNIWGARLVGGNGLEDLSQWRGWGDMRLEQPAAISLGLVLTCAVILGVAVVLAARQVLWIYTQNR